MNTDDLGTVRAVTGWCAAHPSGSAAVVVAVLLGVVVLAAIAQRRRGRRVVTVHRRRWTADHVVTRLASLVALVLSADGGYRLMRTGLDLPVAESVVVCAVAELAIVAEAMRAERSIREHGHPGGHHLAVWGIAVGTGIVVSSSAHNRSEHLVRLAVPLVVALLWWMGVREGTHRRPEAVTWLISPRRVGVALRLIRPGVDDLTAHDTARRARTLARLLHRHATASTAVRPGWPYRWRVRRIHRLAETADDQVLAAVGAQLTRTADVLALAGITTTSLPGYAPVLAGVSDGVSVPVSVGVLGPVPEYVPADSPSEYGTTGYGESATTGRPVAGPGVAVAALRADSRDTLPVEEPAPDPGLSDEQIAAILAAEFGDDPPAIRALMRRFGIGQTRATRLRDQATHTITDSHP